MRTRFHILVLTILLAVAQPVSAIDRWVVSTRIDSAELYAEYHPDLAAIESAIVGVSRELTVLVGDLAARERIQIMLFRDQHSYLDYLSSRIPQARHRKAIYYRNGDVHQIYAWNSRSLLTDLRHEMTHAILHQHLPYVPLWLDEGLAEYLEESPLDRESSRRSVSARWKARTGWKPSLASLEAIRSADSMSADDYRDSWAWTCFLINESDESLQLLRNFVDAIHRGEAPGSFSRFAEAESPGLINRSNSYFRKISIRVVSQSSPARASE